MHIIARKMLLDFSAKYPDAEKPLASWWTVCKKNNFSSFKDLRQIFKTADMVDKCVIFNIGGGKYRLIVRVNFSAHRMWIKYILPHAKYEKLNLKENSRCQP
ncbi:MAG: type II toxin-antitoxin system HigB family toxin [Desulfobacterales bacterium]|jgi:mRNA interferase HigB